MAINTYIDRLNSINLHDLPTGKYTFNATVQEIKDIQEMDYYGNYIDVPYVYFKNIQIQINGNWFHIDCSGNSVKSKLGERLKKNVLKK